MPKPKEMEYKNQTVTNRHAQLILFNPKVSSSYFFLELRAAWLAGNCQKSRQFRGLGEGEAFVSSQTCLPEP